MLHKRDLGSDGQEPCSPSWPPCILASMGRGTAMGPLLFWVQGSLQLLILPALASPQPPNPFLPWAHRELRGCCSGTGPSLCSEAPQEGLGTHFPGGHRGCSGPGSAPCSNSITCKFSSGSPLAQGCLLPLGQRGERPGPSVLTLGNPWWGGGSRARDHPQNH